MQTKVQTNAFSRGKWKPLFVCECDCAFRFASCNVHISENWQSSLQSSIIHVAMKISLFCLRHCAVKTKEKATGEKKVMKITFADTDTKRDATKKKNSKLAST